MAESKMDAAEVAAKAAEKEKEAEEAVVEVPTLDIQRIESVQLSSLVVMKLVRHVTQNLPASVTGQLLGLDVAGKLEVNHSFPFPQQGDDEENSFDDQQYQKDMLMLMRRANADSNTVGWYTSAHLGTFLNETFAATQVSYQKSVENAVVVVYDPLKSTVGNVSLTAYRLTDAFVAMYTKGNVTQSTIMDAKLSYADVLEELPLFVHTSALTEALLEDMDSQLPVGEARFGCLSLKTEPFLATNLSLLHQAVDALGQEQNKLSYYYKNVQRQTQQQKSALAKRTAEIEARRAAGEFVKESDVPMPSFRTIHEPSRLDALLTTNQVDLYCREINSFAVQSFEKLFVADALEKAQ